MALTLLSTNNTFYEWLLRTNDLITVTNGLETGVTSVANTSLVGSLFTLTSNLAVVSVSNGSPDQAEVVYLDFDLSDDVNDSASANIASASLANTIHQFVRSVYDAANTVSTNLVGTNANVANGVVTTAAAFAKANTNATNITATDSDLANTNTTVSGAFLQANTASAQAGGAHGTANTANTTANAALPKAGGTMTGAFVDSVVTLTDGATPALNAALGNIFKLTATGNRTIAVPSNPTDGQRIVIRHFASGANRTLALNTGAGGFRYGTDVPSLLPTQENTWDYIGAVYNGDESFWDVIAYVQGY